MAITYDVPTNTITVTAGTEAAPNTFTDVYNADVAGGWGKVTLQSTTQFLFTCKLKIGDGSTATWFIDTLKQVTIANGFIAYGSSWCEVKANAHLRFGILVDATLKTTKNGVQIISLETDDAITLIYHTGLGTGAIELYSSEFKVATTVYASIYAYQTGISIYNCVFDRVSVNYLKGTLFNSFFYNGKYALFSPISGTIDNIKAWEMKGTAASCYINYYDYSGTATDVYGRNGNYAIRFQGTIAGDCYLINPDFDIWTIYYAGAPNWTGKLYRQYTFDLVTEPNATVILLDKNGDIVFRVKTDPITCAISTQTVSRGYYDQTHGNVLQDNGPHTLIIRKTSYPEYRKQIVIDEKIDWRISLMPGDRSWITEEHKNKETLALLTLHAIQKRRNKRLLRPYQSLE